MKIPGEKTLLNLPVPSILKLLIKKKNDINFYIHISLLLCGASIMFHHSEAPQRGVKIKRLCYFSRLIPDWDDKG